MALNALRLHTLYSWLTLMTSLIAAMACKSLLNLFSTEGAIAINVLGIPDQCVACCWEFLNGMPYQV